MDQEHDNVETEARDGVDTVTGDQAEDPPEALAEGEDGIRVEDEGEGDDNGEAAPAAFVPRDPTMLLGEMRDEVLAGIKGPVGWSKLKETQQVFIANAVEQACRRVIRGAMRIAASMELDAVEVTISGTTHKTDKDQIEAKVLCPFDADTWAAMPAHGKRVLVFADHEKLMGARAASVMKDQPGLFPEETPEQRATREAIDFETEREASIARARQFKSLDDTDTAGAAAAKIIGDLQPPAVKAAADRGSALRLEGGACKIPKDLEGKPAEVNAFLKAWEATDQQADAPAEEVPQAVADPVKAPHGHRGKRTTVAERTAKRLAEASA